MTTQNDTTTIRVLLADDDVLMRSGLRMLLEASSGIEIVGEAGDGLEAVAMAEALRPDVVLMDIRMPNLDGIEATARIVAAQAESEAAPALADDDDDGDDDGDDADDGDGDGDGDTGPVTRVLVLTTFELDE